MTANGEQLNDATVVALSWLNGQLKLYGKDEIAPGKLSCSTRVPAGGVVGAAVAVVLTVETTAAAPAPAPTVDTTVLALPAPAPAAPPPAPESDPVGSALVVVVVGLNGF